MDYILYECDSLQAEEKSDWKLCWANIEVLGLTVDDSTSKFSVFFTKKVEPKIRILFVERIFGWLENADDV